MMSRTQRVKMCIRYNVWPEKISHYQSHNLTTFKDKQLKHAIRQNTQRNKSVCKSRNVHIMPQM